MILFKLFFTSRRSSKTVVKDTSFASICLDLPAKNGHARSARPLPWQTNSIFIISFLILAYRSFSFIYRLLTALEFSLVYHLS